MVLQSVSPWKNETSFALKDRSLLDHQHLQAERA
jgi:hypothetical protein